MERLILGYTKWKSLQQTIGGSTYHVNDASGDIVSVYAGSAAYILQANLSGADKSTWQSDYPSSIACTTHDDAVASVLIDEQLVTPTALVGFRNSFASTNKNVAIGLVNTSATSKVIIRNVAYTQTANDRVRSIRSDNAADASAGTGARTVRITYLRTDFSGPYTEDKTLNGTTWVDTSDTHMMYIEGIEVLTVGSGQTNAGTITLNDNTNGTGAAMCSMVAGDKRLFWAHHFIATGKTCSLMGVSGAGDGVAARISIQFSDLSNSASAAREVVGFRVPPAQQNIDRQLRVPINVAGPALIAAYVKPAAVTAATFWAEFDFYER